MVFILVLDLDLPQKKNQSPHQDETLSLAEAPPRRKDQGRKSSQGYNHDNL